MVAQCNRQRPWSFLLRIFLQARYLEALLSQSISKWLRRQEQEHVPLHPVKKLPSHGRRCFCCCWHGLCRWTRSFWGAVASDTRFHHQLRHCTAAAAALIRLSRWPSTSPQRRLFPEDCRIWHSSKACCDEHSILQETLADRIVASPLSRPLIQHSPHLSRFEEA